MRNGKSGTGNVRDNDVYQALYNYWDDSEDSGSTGNLTTSFKPSIIGKKYPIPTPGQPYAGFMPQQQEQVVDLSIKIGDKVQPIEGLTPSTDIQDCGNGLFVSCNRDAVNAEVAAYMHSSEVAIADEVINAHRQIIESCKNIMVVLNPEIAERQRLEKENSELKTQLKELYKSQSEMKGMMASLLEQLGSPVKKS